MFKIDRNTSLKFLIPWVPLYRAKEILAELKRRGHVHHIGHAQLDRDPSVYRNPLVMASLPNKRHARDR